MSSTYLWFTLWALFLGGMVRSQSPTQTFFPASIPVANRSPYLSAWYNNAHGSSPLSQSWPVGCSQQFLGWSGKIRVDGVMYEWMSRNTGSTFKANVTNIQVTPTRSIFTMQAGPMNISITFLSPIETSDWVLQSLPFSYLSLDASSLDGQNHHIQVYSDITADWLSGNRSSPVVWNHNTSNNSVFHEIQLQSPREAFEMFSQQAQDGIAYYATTNVPGVSWQIGQYASTWDGWNRTGLLTNSAASTASVPIAPAYVGALAVDLGMIQNTARPVTWALGYVRDPVIVYTAPNSTVQRLRPYFVTKYGTDIGAAIDDFLSGYDNALERAIALDNAVMGDASAVSSQYVDLVSLAARQSLSTLDITVSTGSDGNPNASDVRIFMKNIGQPSNTGRVNPVEGIYAALRALLYFNASLVGPLLAPLLDAQDSQESTLPYAAQDIGVAYPNATGTHWPHGQGVEQSGNMLIMMYAHAKLSGDGSLLQQHYSLAKRWANYLVNNTMNRIPQSSADIENAANTTNLAVKGIVAVKAMARISHALGEESDAQEYDSRSAALLEQWQSLALSSDGQRLLGLYDNQSSWALMYNLYADRLLGTSIVSQTLLQKQTTFYDIILGTNPPPFGLNLDNTAQETSTAWLLFTAATVLDNQVRDRLVGGAWTRATSNLTVGAFPDHYNVQTGAIVDGSAGPAVGGVFSFLALNLPTKNIATAGQSQPHRATGHSRIPVGALVGGIAGGAALIALVTTGALFMRKRRSRRDVSPPELHRATSSTYTFLPQSRTTHYDHSLERRSAARASTIIPLDPHESNTSPTPYPRDSQTPHLESPQMQEVSSPTHLPWEEHGLPPSNVLPSENAKLASAQDSISAGLLRSTDIGSLSAGSGPGSGSEEHTPVDVFGLRSEMESLRRVVQELQEERFAPPPEYTG